VDRGIDVLNVARIILFAFALLLIVGGIMGYVEKRSVISLIAGVVCGAMSLAGAWLIATKPTLALGLGIAASVLVGGSMAPRVIKNPKIFPGIVTVGASVLTLVVSIAALMSDRTPAAK
jgi:uncharacterized membrane protein (UPF0136 family)